MTISQGLHYLIFRDASTSLCGRAWARRHEPFWQTFMDSANAWFGAGHCRASAAYHARRRVAP